MCTIDEIIEVFEEMDLDDVDLGSVTPGEIIIHLKNYKRLIEGINSSALECAKQFKGHLERGMNKNNHCADAYYVAIKACEDYISKLETPRIKSRTIDMITKRPKEEVYYEPDKNGVMVAKKRIVYENKVETFVKPYGCMKCVTPCDINTMNRYRACNDSSKHCDLYSERV